MAFSPGYPGHPRLQEPRRCAGSGKSNFFDALRMLQGIGHGFSINEIFNGKPKGPRPGRYEFSKSLLRTRYFDLYRHMDLILFLPDADNKDRTGEFRSLEADAQDQGIRLLCCAAVQAVETWLLAGHQDKLDRPWQDIRNDRAVKTSEFQPFLERHGRPKAPGKGRDFLMAETLSRYGALLQYCPELAILEQRIRQILT